MKKLGAVLLLGFAVVAAIGSPASGQGLLDPNLETYHPVDNLSGELRLAGSNTMAHIASVWADRFQQFYPDVEIKIDIQGSATAVRSVMDGTAEIGMVSRSVAPSEIAAFKTQFGYEPQVLSPSQERIAIFVHPSNPVEGLTLSQLERIFGESPRSGAKVQTWGDLGLTGEWADRPIEIQGRSSRTGSTVFLQNTLGAELDDVEEHGSNISLVKAVGSNPAAIGYAGKAYRTPDVKDVPVAIRRGAPYVGVHNIVPEAGAYPIVRPLQFVVNRKPEQPLDQLSSEFIKYVFSRMGQRDVVKAGFQPISSAPARIALDRVGVNSVR